MTSFMNQFVSDTGLGYNGFEVSLNYISGLPDVNLISDAQLKIIFKSLLKKDDTTKEKALQDLLRLISDDNRSSIIHDDLVIISWVQLYAKLSIDTSKNVRILSHQIQGNFVKVLGKRYAKYLKDTAPLWLAGTFDSEKIVVRAAQVSLLDAFQTEKKVNVFWTAFTEQILNFCTQVVKFESKDTLSDERNVPKDEAQSKYIRVLLAAIQLFTKLLSGEISNGDAYTDFLQMDELWDLVLLSDQALKKALLMLIVSTLKTHPEIVDDKLFKTFSKSIVKSIKYKPVTNNIVYSGIVLPTISAILHASSFNTSFWDLAGKKTKEKFLAFLRLGSCSSSEIYYDLLGRVMHQMSSSVIDLENEEDYQVISDIAAGNVEQEKLLPFRNKSWRCYFEIQEIFYKTQPKLTTQNLTHFLKKHFAKRLSKDIISACVKFIEQTKDDELLKNLVERATATYEKSAKDDVMLVENMYDVLLGLKSDLLNELINNAFDTLDTIEEEQVPWTGFAVITKVITSGNVAFKQQVNEFLNDSFASFVEKDFIHQPLQLLIDYNSSKEFLETETLHEALNSLFNKVLMVDEPSTEEVLMKLPKLTHVQVDKCEDIQSFIVSKSADADSSNKVFFNFLTEDVFINMYKKSVENSTENQFFVEFLNKFDAHIYTNFLNSGDPTVTQFFIKIFQTMDTFAGSKKLLAHVAESDYPVLTSALRHYISGYPFVELDSLVEFLSTDKPDLINGFILSDDNVASLLLDIASTIGEQPDLKLSISNSLEGNVFLCQNAFTSSSSFDYADARKLIAIARFLVTLLKKTQKADQYLRLVILLSVIGEIAIDYSFLSDDDNVQVIDLASEIYGLLDDKVISKTYIVGFVDAIVNDRHSENSSLLKEVCETLNEHINGDDAMAFYFNRVFKSILSNLIEDCSLSQFEGLDINYNKLLKTPLKFSSFILGSKKFLMSSKFDRVRNYVASELIGLKTSQLPVRGLEYLTILQNFLIHDSDKADQEQDGAIFMPIPEQRLNMVIRDMTNWMESEIVYDDEFHNVRIQMISFVIKYLQLFYSINKNTTNVEISKMLELGVLICRDSIGVVSAEAEKSQNSSMVALRYYSLKLYTLLYKSRRDIDSWKDDVDGINEEICDALVSLQDMTNVMTKQQPWKMIFELYAKIFDSLLPFKTIQSQEEFFYEVLKKDVDQVSEALTKVSIAVLHKVILSKQEEFVIEYELSKAKMSAEEEQDSSIMAKVPQVLIENIGPSAVPQEYLEFEENSAKVNNYLWSWILIFDHFKDMTQRIKQDYMKQIGVTNFENLLKFVFDQIDLNTDAEFIKRLSTQFVYKIVSCDLGSVNVVDEFETVIEEQKALIIHIYYLTLVHVGSISQTWFNGLRDRQLKNAIEKFSTRYISSIIIDQELDKVQRAIASSQDQKMDNSTVKINRQTHEIKSLYEVDEQKMEMVVKIPNCYPLQPVIVEGPTRLGVKEAQWKSWLMASQRLITSQNSTIVGAIELFNKNVSLHFSGFEECAICYSILHYQDKSLPTKSCTTCNNKFHAACLYKWFRSSGGSTCPLCRSVFNFRR